MKATTTVPTHPASESVTSSSRTCAPPSTMATAKSEVTTKTSKSISAKSEPVKFSFLSEDEEVECTAALSGPVKGAGNRVTNNVSPLTVSESLTCLS